MKIKISIFTLIMGATMFSEAQTAPIAGGSAEGTSTQVKPGVPSQGNNGQIQTTPPQNGNQINGAIPFQINQMNPVMPGFSSNSYANPGNTNWSNGDNGNSGQMNGKGMSGMTNGVRGNPYANYTNPNSVYVNPNSTNVNRYANYTNPNSAYVNPNSTNVNRYANYTNPYWSGDSNTNFSTNTIGSSSGHYGHNGATNLNNLSRQDVETNINHGATTNWSNVSTNHHWWKGW